MVASRREQMVFSPIHDDHAIDAVSFTLRLSQPLTAASIRKIQSAHKMVREELPAVNTPQSIDLRITPTGPSEPRIISGIEFSHLRPDGTPTWIVRAMGSDVVVETTRYTRWQKVWPRTEKYFNLIIEKLREIDPKPAVSVVAHSVVDRFLLSEGADARTSLRDIGADNGSMSIFVYDREAAWHQNLGWFEEHAARQVLNNLNIDFQQLESKRVSLADGPAWVLSIAHTQEVRDVNISTSDGIDPLAHLMEKYFNIMHECNKKALRSVLSGPMLERIGLDAGNGK